MGRKKGSGGGFSKILSVSVSPAQREFLLRKKKETAAGAAQYLRLLLDREMDREMDREQAGKEAKND